MDGVALKRESRGLPLAHAPEQSKAQRECFRPGPESQMSARKDPLCQLTRGVLKPAFCSVALCTALVSRLVATLCPEQALSFPRPNRRKRPECFQVGLAPVLLAA